MIILYLGLMGSGKTEHLLKDYLYSYSNNKLLITSSLNRTEGYVTSRCGLKYKADIELDRNESYRIQGILKEKNYTDIFIDEFQFFDKTILDVINNNQDKNWYLSGLEYNSQRQVFGHILEIKNNYSCQVKEFEMTCQKCKKEIAKDIYQDKNLCKTNSTIFVGDKEYMSVCSICYSVLSEN